MSHNEAEECLMFVKQSVALMSYCPRQAKGYWICFLCRQEEV